MRRKRILYAILCLVIRQYNLCAGRSEYSTSLVYYSCPVTPTQEIVIAIQKGNIHQLQHLWARYQGKYLDYATIFAAVCKSKHYTVLAWLLRATPFATQYYHEYGRTLLIDGVMYNDIKLLTLLLANSYIDINTQSMPGGWTALMMAAEKSSFSVVKFLLTSGADLKIKDFEGRDAGWWAQSVDRSDIIGLLGEYQTLPKVCD